MKIDEWFCSDIEPGDRYPKRALEVVEYLARTTAGWTDEAVDEGRKAQSHALAMVNAHLELAGAALRLYLKQEKKL